MRCYASSTRTHHSRRANYNSISAQHPIATELRLQPDLAEATAAVNICSKNPFEGSAGYALRWHRERAAPQLAATSLNRRKVSMCSSRLAMRYIG
jgi:hypothetical protein